MSVEESDRIYLMRNDETGAEVETNSKYLAEWLARGFYVVEIRDSRCDAPINPEQE
jgi:hypothetical protein